ncbi:MAG: FAD-binding protein [Nitrospiraceae bacterium]|nr:FAD-binding protein [Nitrospiraceae bacterium]
MGVSAQQRFADGVDCEVRFDNLARQLHATDASIYQLEPIGVAFPRNAQQAAAIIRAAVDAGIPVTPRGAGTGLAGGAIGNGLVVDLAHYHRTITDLDLDARTVRVGAGVVLDQLNAFVQPHGLCFGPDVATSSRATLGGMIANNSSGARAPIYGVTDAHVLALEAVLADGRVVTIDTGPGALDHERDAIDQLVSRHADAIRERFPGVLVKRWPGYGIDRYLRARGDLTKIVSGSEGTLAAIVSAKLKLCPLPQRKGLGLAFFASVQEAMQASVELLALKPAAVEHIDRFVMDETKGQMTFQSARDLLALDTDPCEAILIVEFYDGVGDDSVDDKLAAFCALHLGLRSQICTDAAEMAMVWALRKSGLSLMAGRKGPAKPVAGLEDVAVRPEDLSDYVAALRAALEPLGLESSFYGHAASGLVHVRPLIDLHRGDDIAKYRQAAEATAKLTRQFRGSLAGEHGVGMARAEFMEGQIGEELLGLMRSIKNVFDPKGLLNPGKIFPLEGYGIDTHLRWGDGHTIELSFEPTLAFAAKDESFVGNLEQCNGCGGCRKDEPTMCPTFRVTGEEIMVTRGRANTIRAVLERRIKDSDDPVTSKALEEALDYCLSCKACKKECPSNVDLALLKAELLHARHKREGISLLERLVSRFDLIGNAGSVAPGLANATLNIGFVRLLMEKIVGFSAKRPLPAYATERFDRWFAKRPAQPGSRGRVYLWDDCSVRYYEPEIGHAAVKVLEAAGYEVVLPGGRSCCGRPAFSVGCLDIARRFGADNVALFNAQADDAPIVFLEPSCYSMFAGDYEELKIPEARRVAERCVLFEQFIFDLLEREPGALTFESRSNPVAIHGHCHAKALTDVAVMPTLAGHIPGAQVDLLDTGCCGMAGSFGAIKKKYELSVEVAQPLADMVDALAPGTRLVASGTSCRQQITHLTQARPMHMAELLAEALP